MSTRRGDWLYGDHEGLNPSWRLGDTNLVLDFDRTNQSGPLIGAYVLWRDGREGEPIDHYLDGAMRWVERECVTRPPTDDPDAATARGEEF